MPEVRVGKQIAIILSEDEAGKLKSILFDHVRFEDEEWVCELYDTLDSLDVSSVPYAEEEWADLDDVELDDEDDLEDVEDLEDGE